MNPVYDRFSPKSFSLNGKVAIITGANMGLGMAYASAYAKMGADLFIPHLTDDIAEVKELVEKEGRKAVFYQGDLTNKAYRDSIVEKCVAEYGKVDVLINNAGANAFAPIQEFRDEVFARVIEIDLNCSYYLARQVALQMIRQGGGKIINIASIMAFMADHNCPPYIVAKHGVHGLIRYLANDLGQYNIQCNGIAPGFFATEVNAPLRADPNSDFMHNTTRRIPAGHWGELNDLMGIAVFLGSDAANYINGVLVSVDGGFLCTL